MLKQRYYSNEFSGFEIKQSKKTNKKFFQVNDYLHRVQYAERIFTLHNNVNTHVLYIFKLVLNRFTEKLDFNQLILSSTSQFY